MTIRELMQAFSKKTGTELTGICKENLLKIHRYFREKNINNDFRAAYNRGIWKLFVSADKTAKEDEYLLFLYSVGFNKEEFSRKDFYEATNRGSETEFVQWFIRETKKFPTEIRNAVCTVGVCIMSVDEDITDSEVQLLERLLN